jgi:3-carboxy-cis,cis-muconate cycloisomerase
LPHKRNPVGAAAALSAAAVAPNLVATLLAAQVQEHERAPGGWHTDWMTFPTLALVTSGALSAVVEIAEGLEIDVERLRANLELTGGQIMAEAVSFALAEKVGRAEAHALVRELSQKAAQEKRPFKEALLNDLRIKAQLSGLEIEKLFIPLTYQGSAQTFIDRLVVTSQMRTPRRPDIRTEIKPLSPPPARPAEVPLPVAAQLPPVANSATVADVSPPTPSAVPDTAPSREDHAAGALMDVLTRPDTEAVPLDKDKFKIS